MFENPSGGARRGQAPPVIVADETLNSIVFRASSTDGQAIRAMVEQLDTQEQAAKKNYRIIKVAAGMNLTKLAEDVEDAVNESAEQVGGGGAGRGRQQPRVTITPNAQTRTLLVAGTPTLFDQVEEIVQAYEGMGPQAGETTTAIFSLKNVTPEEVDALIGQLTDQGSAAGRSPSRSSGGPRPPAQNRPRRPNP
jgi:type II secretory pathway component GspD/PulD (secretin)